MSYSVPLKVKIRLTVFDKDAETGVSTIRTWETGEKAPRGERAVALYNLMIEIALTVWRPAEIAGLRVAAAGLSHLEGATCYAEPFDVSPRPQRRPFARCCRCSRGLQRGVADAAGRGDRCARA